MQEFCRYPDLLSHSSSFIEHFARTFLAGCVKAIKLFLRGNPPRVVSAPIVDEQRFRYGDDCRFSVQGLCQSNPILNALFRDIRSIRAHENVGVHSGLPCSSNIFPKKLMLTYLVRSSLYGPIVAVRLRPNLEAHSWTNERQVMAHLRHAGMSGPCRLSER